MNVKVFFIASTCLLVSCMLKAQDMEMSKIEQLEQRTQVLENAVKSLQKIKVSGYIHAQYQFAQTDADGMNFKLAKARNAYETSELKDYGRFGLRRGRVKFTYEDGIASGVVQIDVTEKGIDDNGRNVVMFKDIYLQVKDPWMGTNMLKAGVFERPFGFEIAYSSSRRESPERSRIFQTIFPDERDLGFSLTLQPAKTHPLNILKFEGGLFAGNGIRPQISSKMDFIGRLSVLKPVGSDVSIGAGVSAYLGGVLQTGDPRIFVMKNKEWVVDNDNENNIGKYAKRQYIGFDAQFNVMTAAGLTQIRGEYIFGEHAQNEAGSWNYKFVGIQTGPVYMRKINGGYAILTQDVEKTPFTFVAKYDWYNPNTQISGNDIANSRELNMSNIGLGIYWRINPALRLTAYYDIVKNETTNQLPDTKDEAGKITAYGWDKDRKDNVFTLRLQYKF
jgi:hypothetical protein